MNDREKLIELLGSAESAFYWNSDDKSFVEKIADHLIANGMVISNSETTTQRWIPVTERLPGEECLAVAARTGEMMIGRLVVSTIGWCCESAVSETLFGVTHWMPLPPAPEEE